MERCPQSQLARPRVTTLVADPNEPTHAAYVVTPACDEELLTLAYGKSASGQLAANSRGIEAVVSVPTATEQLLLDGNRLSSLDLRAATSATHISLSSNNISSLTGFVSPSSLLELSLYDNPIDMVTETQFPPRLEKLWLGNTSFTSFVGASFPTSLRLLGITSMTSLGSLQGLVLPPQLDILYVSGDMIQVSGVTFPVTLTELYIGDEPLTRFDVRASDVEVLSSISIRIYKGTNITTCVDPRGAIQTLQFELQACVYADQVFDELFPARGTTDTPSPPRSTTSDTPQRTVPATSLVPSSPTASPTGSSNRPMSSTTTGDTRSSPTPTPTKLPSTTDHPTTAILGLLVALAVIALAFVLRRRRKRASMPAKPATSTALVPLPAVTNDVREDADFFQFNVSPSELVVQSAPMTTSIYMSVYHAKLYGRNVAVKRFAIEQDQHLEEEDASTTHALQSFLDEIRLWATLDHPAIVAFVGVSWTQSELSLVTEWMAQGDLRSMIQCTFGGATNSPPWFHYQLEGEGNTNSSEPVWSKAAIALDVAEALVYLHSFTPPILHGDVSTANVLVSSSYRAKLSNFSRSGHGDGDDDTMEYRGSSAMAPPEIQRGDRYSAKGDVYGLGTVMNELASRDGVDCPVVIREVVAACLQTDPSDRPAAMEVHYRLRQAIAAAHQP